MFEQVKEILELMKGRVLEDENSITLVAYNTFGERKVKCELCVHLQKSEEWPFCVDVREETMMIKGGRGCPCKDMKEVISEVNRGLTDYHFEEERQLRLF